MVVPACAMLQTESRIVPLVHSVDIILIVIVTNKQRPARIIMDTLPPFPEGWFFVTTRKALLGEKLIEKTWMGEEIVAWCDGEGRICVADAMCPHLGSHLGPTVGGIVRDGCLVCPFHGFEFDTTGQCVATPNAPAPKAAKLKVYETREILGLVFAWYGSNGRPVQWDLPDGPPSAAEWGEPGFRTLRFRGHPQETAENSVDFGHLRYVHGYDNVTPVGSVTVDGAYLKSCFDFKRVRRILGIKDLVYDISAVTHIYGLGYSLVEIHEKTIDMNARLWVLLTPIDGTLIDLVLVSQLREIRKPRRFITGLGFLPMKLRQRLMNYILLSQQKRDVLQDVVIWERKRYQTPPRLCRADGPIGTYRRYCRQFYPDLTIATGSGDSIAD
ncbi:MAG: Rieske 2Fe-2S domain-containing protein [Gemmatimonadetes bacterium]|nr:Rieske 2Fe-2S domain-containing protein [Gemmatimonadota bacterium]